MPTVSHTYDPLKKQHYAWKKPEWCPKKSEKSMPSISLTYCICNHTNGAQIQVTESTILWLHPSRQWSWFSNQWTALNWWCTTSAAYLLFLSLMYSLYGRGLHKSQKQKCTHDTICIHVCSQPYPYAAPSKIWVHLAIWQTKLLSNTPPFFEKNKMLLAPQHLRMQFCHFPESILFTPKAGCKMIPHPDNYTAQCDK